jgi:carboxymethylenebutenolidase
MKMFISLCTIILLAGAAPAQEWAKAELEKSPRHGEWVKLKHGTREVNSFIVYPEVKDKATAVLVIHEIFGLTDWVRTVADELAAAGYIAIAPDLLSGVGPNGGGTDSLGGQSNVVRVIQTLPPDQITADLNAAVDYVAKLPSANGKVVVGGFCWGGQQTFRFTTNNKNIKAGFVFYGAPPAPPDMSRIACPVYGFYGGDDNRITSTVPKTTERMKTAGKTYEPETYEGAGHGFMRAGADPTSTASNKVANKKAHDEAWARWKELLKKV